MGGASHGLPDPEHPNINKSFNRRKKQRQLITEICLNFSILFLLLNNLARIANEFLKKKFYHHFSILFKLTNLREEFQHTIHSFNFQYFFLFFFQTVFMGMPMVYDAFRCAITLILVFDVPKCIKLHAGARWLLKRAQSNTSKKVKKQASKRITERDISFFTDNTPRDQ